jgi:multidrug efflux pump
VTAAIKAQNAQVAVGQLGGAPSVKASSSTPPSTRRRACRPRSSSATSCAVRRTVPSCAWGRRRVELGAESYDFVTRYNGKPASGLAVTLATGANALDTAAVWKPRWKT